MVQDTDSRRLAQPLLKRNWLPLTEGPNKHKDSESGFNSTFGTRVSSQFSQGIDKTMPACSADVLGGWYTVVDRVDKT